MRLPLYARILLWFLLNVTVLGAALIIAMRIQIRNGLDTFMGSVVSAKLQSAGEDLNARLAATPRDQWQDILSDMQSRHGVQAQLRYESGGHIAGTELDLPAIVEKELGIRRDSRRSRASAQPPPPDAPEDRGTDSPPSERPENAGPDERREGGRPFAERGEGPDAIPDFDPRAGEGGAEGRSPRGRSRPIPQAPSQYMKILMTAGQPERYWAVILMPPQFVPNSPPRPLMLVIATDSIFTNGLLFDLRPWLLVVGAALLFSALLWLPVVRGITGKIKETMRAAEQMSRGKFDVRVREDRSDELGRLAAGVNQMARQLDGYVTGQRRFTGDIAHELCSPISRMQAALGILEARVTDEKQLGHITTLHDELQHMSHLVQELLQFSKASLHRDLQFTSITLVDLAQAVVARESQGYPDDSALVQIPETIRVYAEPELLARALGNVIRNALRYASQAGPVVITATAAGEEVRIAVSDQGPGVPPEALPRIFDAFYRPDPDRGRDHGGAGLGLAIVKSAVEACHGSVSARNRQPSGLEVTLCVKASPQEGQ